MKRKCEKWVRWIDIICNDVEFLCFNKKIYLEVSAIIDSNPKLKINSSFYEFLDNGYTALAVMGIRRQIKPQKDCVSLVRLLKDINTNAEKMLHEKFRIDNHMVTQDIDSLRSVAKSCEMFADRRIAHSDTKKVDPHPTFFDLDKCINLLEEFAVKYRCLLTEKGGTLVPTILDDWKEIFKIPWIDMKYHNR